MNPAVSVSGSISGATGAGPAASSHPSHHVTGAPFGDRRPGLALLALHLLELQRRGELLLGERHVVVQPRDDDVRQPDGLEHVREVRVQQVEHDHDRRRAVAELVLHLAGRVERVVADDDRAQACRRVERDHVLGAVRHDERHPVALADPHAGERRRAAFDLPQERRVGDLPPEPRERRRLGVPARRRLEHPEHGQVGVGLQAVRNALGVGREPRPVIGHPRASFQTGEDGLNRAGRGSDRSR